MFLFPDIIKEVIDQQSTIYDNVTLVANFFKYEQVSLFLNLALLLQTLLYLQSVTSWGVASFLLVVGLADCQLELHFQNPETFLFI